jgi:hypothetical protein
MKPKFIFCLALVLGGGLFGCLQIARADETNARASASPMRYLGNFEEMESSAGFVILEDVSNIQTDTNQPVLEVYFTIQAKPSQNTMQVWLLATNGDALPSIGGGITDPEKIKGAFLFKKTQTMEKLYGVAIQYGKEVKFFKIPPVFQNLSADAQFYFDELTSYSAETLEKFESGRLNWKKSDEQEIMISIKDVKQELQADKVNVVWDHNKRAYRIQ